MAGAERRARERRGTPPHPARPKKKNTAEGQEKTGHRRGYGEVTLPAAAAAGELERRQGVLTLHDHGPAAGGGARRAELVADGEHADFGFRRARRAVGCWCPERGLPAPERVHAGAAR